MSFWHKVFAGKQHRGALNPHFTLPTPPLKAYAMKRIGADSAEIVLYGDIVSERPTDWWGDPIDGQYIILSEFLEELKTVEDVAQLTVRIHSVGGNAHDALTIHNRLRALKAHVTVIIDGVAMSGGAMIACAGDVVQVFPGILVMIHKCWGYAVGNADDLRKSAEGYDATDRSQVAIFQAKTGLDVDELLSMMSAETYMTGQEAIDKGFADEMVEGSSLKIAASADRRTLFVGATPVWVSARKDGIPSVIPTVDPEASATVATNTQQPGNPGSQEGGKRTMANTLEELRRENPGLATQLEAEAKATVSTAVAPTVTTPTTPVVQPSTGNDEGTAKAAQDERQRIQAIDEVAHLFNPETVREAKYGNPCTAPEMAYRAAQKAAKQGTAFLAALEADAFASGTGKVGAAVALALDAGETLTPAQRMAKGKSDAKALKNPQKEEL